MKISVVGLGYVGLPLAIALAKYYSVVGFDKSTKRIAELKKGQDANGEIDRKSFKGKKILFSSRKKCSLSIRHTFASFPDVSEHDI